MTVARKFRAPNRLSMLVRANGGVMAKDALAAAEAALERCAPNRWRSWTPPWPRSRTASAGRRRRPARPAPTRTSTPWPCGSSTCRVSCRGPCVDQAAISFCALVDNCSEAGAWRWDAIDVHINALRLLRTSDLNPDQRRAVIDGLNKVSQRRIEDA